LSKLPTSGIDFSEISESDLRQVNLLGAMLYHGVDSEAGVVMRMSAVPRVAAKSLGQEFAEGRTETEMRPSFARIFLDALSGDDWGRHLPPGASMDGRDLSRLWRVLSGTPIQEVAASTADR
jgi:hypothetical protein